MSEKSKIEPNFAIVNINSKCNNLDKSTINLTLRNLTWRNKDEIESELDSSHSSYCFTDIDTIIESEREEKNDPHQTINNYLKFLKNQKKQTKVLFCLFQAFFTSFSIFSIAFFNKKHKFIIFKIAPLFFWIYFGLDSLYSAYYRISKKEIKKERKFKFLLVLKSVICFSIIGFSGLFLFTYDYFNKFILLFIFLIFSIKLFSIFLLVYMIFVQCEPLKSAFIALFNLTSSVILVLFYYRLMNPEKIIWVIVFFPMFTTIIFSAFFFVYLCQFFLILINYFTGNEPLNFVVIKLVEVSFFLLLAVYTLFVIIICFGVDIETYQLMYQIWSLIIIFLSIFPILFQKKIFKTIDSEKRMIENFKETHLKIKAEVPIYLRKDKKKSYFKKLGNKELQKFKLKDKINKMKKKKENAKSNTSLTLDLKKSLRKKPDKNFKIKKQKFSLRILTKENIELEDGQNISLRTFTKNENLLNNLKKNQNQNSSITNLSKINISQTLRSLRKKKKSNRDDFEDFDSVINDDSCVVCYSNNSNVVIMNCGHSDICDGCAKDIWKSSCLCYLCQQPIEYLVVIEKVEDNVFKVVYCIYLEKRDVQK